MEKGQICMSGEYFYYSIKYYLPNTIKNVFILFICVLSLIVRRFFPMTLFMCVCPVPIRSERHLAYLCQKQYATSQTYITV